MDNEILPLQLTDATRGLPTFRGESLKRNWSMTDHGQGALAGFSHENGCENPVQALGP